MIVARVWENGAILYEDDELVNYSLARYLKMRISKSKFQSALASGATTMLLTPRPLNESSLAPARASDITITRFIQILMA